jgi:hypothetical protein
MPIGQHAPGLECIVSLRQEVTVVQEPTKQANGLTSRCRAAISSDGAPVTTGSIIRVRQSVVKGVP